MGEDLRHTGGTVTGRRAAGGGGSGPAEAGSGHGTTGTGSGFAGHRPAEADAGCGGGGAVGGRDPGGAVGVGCVGCAGCVGCGAGVGGCGPRGEWVSLGEWLFAPAVSLREVDLAVLRDRLGSMGRARAAIAASRRR